MYCNVVTFGRRQAERHAKSICADRRNFHRLFRWVVGWVGGVRCAADSELYTHHAPTAFDVTDGGRTGATWCRKSIARRRRVSGKSEANV